MKKLFIFGSTGDLVKRKIIPAFVELQDDDLEIIALGRREFTDEMYHSFICDGDCFKNFKLKPKYQKINIDKFVECKECDEHLAKDGENFFYVAMPPKNLESVIKYLGSVKDKGFKLSALIEKPFGINLSEAKKLKKLAEDHGLLDNIFISDHYLFKEEILNLKAGHFKKIKIVSLESVGLEKRITYYDEVGALKDMVQSHFLNIVFKLLNSSQDPKKEFESFEVLRYIRGQYGDGKKAGYIKDLGKKSNTETFVHVLAKTKNLELEFVTGKKFDKKITFIELDDNRIELNGSKNPYSRLFLDFFGGHKESFATIDQSILGWEITEKIEAKNSDLAYYEEGLSVQKADEIL